MSLFCLKKGHESRKRRVGYTELFDFLIQAHHHSQIVFLWSPHLDVFFTEGKIIERKNNTYLVIKDLRDVAIPSTIKDVIMARIDTLPEGSKELLQTGSVIGREFCYELIQRVMELSERALLSSLSLLKDSELLYERGVYPQSAFIFKHALTQAKELFDKSNMPAV